MATTPEWTQDDVELVVTLTVPAATATRDVACKIGATSLSVSVGGDGLFVDELCAKCDVDESFWALEGSGEGRRLLVTLTKLKTGRQWPFLGKALAARELAESGAGAGGSASGGCDDGAAAAAAAGGGAAGGASGDLLSLGNYMDDEDVEDAELQQQQEVQLEAAFNALKDEKGLDDEQTLTAFFEFFNIGIQLYHLNKLSGYLTDVSTTYPPPQLDFQGRF